MCVRVRGAGGPEVLELAPTKVRDPGPDEVRIAVSHAALNRADILQRKGFYPAPVGSPPDILGLEYAGTVESVGANVSERRAGDRVMGLVGGGAMCTRLVVHARETIAIPESLGQAEAAAIPEAFITAWDALVLQARLSPSETLLIHAVGSGIGTAAVQIAKAYGAITVGTSRTPSKLQACRELGLDVGVLARDGRFAADVSAAIPTGIDVVLDCVGGNYLEETTRTLALKARIVCLGTLAGRESILPLGVLLAKRVTWFGSVLRSRPLEEKITMARAFERAVMPLFAKNALRPVVHTVLPMREIREAHRCMEADESIGKIVLAW